MTDSFDTPRRRSRLHGSIARLRAFIAAPASRSGDPATPTDPAGTATTMRGYVAPCRRILESGATHEQYAMPWSGRSLTPVEPTTVIVEHDPGRTRVVLQPGDVLEAMGRGWDTYTHWCSDGLWVRSGAYAGTCVYTEKLDPGLADDVTTPGFAPYDIKARERDAVAAIGTMTPADGVSPGRTDGD
jgi:hypothetical protein